MSIGISQNLKISQSLRLTPYMRQAVNILQMHRLELNSYLNQQITENPMLEIDEDRDEESYFKIQEFKSARTNNHDGNINYENFLENNLNIFDHISQQFSNYNLNAQERATTYLIIGNLDEKGFFNMPLDILAKKENIKVEKLKNILDIVKTFDPPGIGAKDIKECLSIQLINKKLDNTVAYKIIKYYFKELLNGNFDLIKKKLNISDYRLQENIKIISKLSPNPIVNISNQGVNYIVPDIYIYKNNKKWQIDLNRQGIYNLKINYFYKKVANNKESKTYINEKIQSANWLIKSLEEREKTIYKISKAILKRQINFFNYGVKHLKPMILNDIASDVNMHESTISRVARSKFVHTERGIFELKFFFNNYLKTNNGILSSKSVKEQIFEIIKEENKKNPYSDESILQKLNSTGIKISRRTITKYRKQLQIPSSHKRKIFFKISNQIY